jgi:hypothetical protein
MPAVSATTTRIDMAAWTEWHAVRAPWCDPTRCTSHDMRLNGPDRVNGVPAGPSAALTVHGVAEVFVREQKERAARFRAIVDELLAEAAA